jgi:hypothetical protein
MVKTLAFRRSKLRDVSKKRRTIFTLARFAGEGRGEGSESVAPHPDPLTKRWWRGNPLYRLQRRELKPIAFQVRVLYFVEAKVSPQLSQTPASFLPFPVVIVKNNVAAE